MYVEKITPRGKEPFILSLLAAYLRSNLKDEVFFSLLEKYQGINKKTAVYLMGVARSAAKKKGFSDAYIKERYKEIKIEEV